MKANRSQRPPARRQTILADLPPLRMLIGLLLGPDHGDIARHADAVPMTRLHLFAQQIPFEVWVHRAHASGIVAQAVMAGREAGDRLNMRLLEGARELLGIEVLANRWNQRRGMKVEMDLAEW